MNRRRRRAAREAAEAHAERRRRLRQAELRGQAERERAQQEALRRADGFDFDALESLFHDRRPAPDGSPLLQAVRGKVGGHRHGRRTRRFRDLVLIGWQMDPRLRRVELVEPLWALAASSWLRPIAEWRPKGRGAEARFRSLVRHLLVRWPVPAFLFRGFERGELLATRFARLIALLGQGGSSRLAIERGLLPPTLTRRMCHLFLASPAGTGPVEAIRRAQVVALGGDRRLADRVCDTPLGADLTDAEPFWARFIQWLVNHPDLAEGCLDPAHRYLEQRLVEEPDLCLSGWSAATLQRRVQAWADELARERRLKGTVFEASGLPGGSWQLPARPGDPRSEWTLEELLFSKALRAEGRAMKHCVHTYCRLVGLGRTSIWSLRRDGTRELTLEVDNRHRRIVQAKGRLNRPASREAQRILQRWALEAGLEVGRYL